MIEWAIRSHVERRMRKHIIEALTDAGGPLTVEQIGKARSLANDMVRRAADELVDGGELVRDAGGRLHLSA